MGKVAEKEVADLFGAVGAFLAEHRLSPEPVHYAFAYQVISDPDGPLARSVAQITDGGVRLRRQDIQNLGGDAIAGAPVGTDSTAVEPTRRAAPIRRATRRR